MGNQGYRDRTTEDLYREAEVLLRQTETLYREAEALLSESTREMNLAIAGLENIRTEWQAENRAYLSSGVSFN
ncbi:MAG: hypothetical protein ABIH92_04690 [Nanoarchaeota archaeon]